MIRSEIMKRITAPMVGGIGTSFTLGLLVYPAIYAVWRERLLKQELEHHSLEAMPANRGHSYTPHNCSSTPTALRLDARYVTSR